MYCENKTGYAGPFTLSGGERNPPRPETYSVYLGPPTENKLLLFPGALTWSAFRQLLAELPPCEFGCGAWVSRCFSTALRGLRESVQHPQHMSWNEEGELTTLLTEEWKCGRVLSLQKSRKMIWGPLGKRGSCSFDPFLILPYIFVIANAPLLTF